jgi:hypothetical protein
LQILAGNRLPSRRSAHEKTGSDRISEPVYIFGHLAFADRSVAIRIDRGFSCDQFIELNCDGDVVAGGDFVQQVNHSA